MHLNGANSYLVVNGVEIYKFKAKDFEINTAPLILYNVSKDLSADNMKNTGLYGYVYDFSVDYDNIHVDDILDIHKYFMKQHATKCCLDLFKKIIGLLNACIIGSFGESLNYNSKRPIKCLTLNNRPCQARPILVNINSDETFFYPFTVSVNKCGGICNTIDDAWFLFQIK